jgi:hypothetical protein
MRVESMRYKRILLSTLTVFVGGISGCITDNLIFDPYSPGGTDPSDGGTSYGFDTSSSGVEAPQTKLGSDGSLYGGYDQFYTANATWAPGAITSFIDNTHTGWNNARCFDCHAVGMPDEPADHDPRMQYWPWSCARGFPGSSCHGHGVTFSSSGINNTPYFNHDSDPMFDGCTQSNCHDTNDASKERENHGFMEAPDVFCNSCHDWYWETWPS